MSYDYTQGQNENVEDLVIGAGAAIDHDADTTEALAEERQWFQLEPGVHTCMVTGFITPKNKSPRKLVPLYISGQERRVELYSVIVKFGEVTDPRHQVTDQFYLPPDRPDDLKFYNYGTTKPDGKAPGFHAEKFGHFLNRLYPGTFSKGQAIPPEARTLKNWIGRQIVLETVLDKNDAVDPSTGKPYPPRCQVKLYSYRSAGSGVTQYANGPQATQPQAGFNGDPTGRIPMGSVSAPPRATQQRPMPAGARNI